MIAYGPGNLEMLAVVGGIVVLFMIVVLIFRGQGR